jgi:hypothetical protein
MLLIIANKFDLRCIYMGDVCNGTSEKTPATSIAAVITFGFLGHGTLKREVSLYC